MVDAEFEVRGVRLGWISWQIPINLGMPQSPRRCDGRLCGSPQLYVSQPQAVGHNRG